MPFTCTLLPDCVLLDGVSLLYLCLLAIPCLGNRRHCYPGFQVNDRFRGFGVFVRSHRKSRCSPRLKRLNSWYCYSLGHSGTARHRPAFSQTLLKTVETATNSQEQRETHSQIIPKRRREGSQALKIRKNSIAFSFLISCFHTFSVVQ